MPTKPDPKKRARVAFDVTEADAQIISQIRAETRRKLGITLKDAAIALAVFRRYAAVHLAQLQEGGK
jgi:hypothetical protein